MNPEIGETFVLIADALDGDLLPGITFTLDRSDQGRPDVHLRVERRDKSGAWICTVIERA